MAYDTINNVFTDIAAQGVTCWCGVHFAIPQTLYNEYRRKNDAERGSMSLYCPLGHSMIPARPSEAQRQIEALKKQRANWEEYAEKMAKEAEQAKRSAAANRGVVTKMKRRLGKGVCPCCNRYFAQLHRHVQSQHPDFLADTE